MGLSEPRTAKSRTPYYPTSLVLPSPSSVSKIAVATHNLSRTAPRVAKWRHTLKSLAEAPPLCVAQNAAQLDVTFAIPVVWKPLWMPVCAFQQSWCMTADHIQVALS